LSNGIFKDETRMHPCARKLQLSRDSSQDPFLRVSVSKVSGVVSVSKISGLETLNIAKQWFIQLSMFQRFFVCCICRK